MALALVSVAVLTAVLARPAAPPTVRLLPTPAPTPTAQPAVQQAGRLIDAALAVQARALRAGDERAWLSVVDPASAELVATYRLRLRVLRDMLAADWSPRSAGDPVAAGRGRWRVGIAATFCLGTTSCSAARPEHGTVPDEAFTADTVWQVRAGAALLVAEDPTSDGASGSNAEAPWITDDLVVAVGARVVVAAPVALQTRLQEVLPVAERAGENADVFALGAHPGRYVIYLAGATEWKAWFGGGLPEWATAYAPPTSRNHRAVVLNLGVPAARGIESALRHELGHVVTMGDASSAAVPFWLAEGVAEWIDEGHRPALDHPFLPAVRRYLRDVGLAGLDALAPTNNDPQWRVSGLYGVAYLAVRYLADAYGREAVLNFLAERKIGTDVRTSSLSAFGATWPSVESDLIARIQRLSSG